MHAICCTQERMSGPRKRQAPSRRALTTCMRPSTASLRVRPSRLPNEAGGFKHLQCRFTLLVLVFVSYQKIHSLFPWLLILSTVTFSAPVGETSVPWALASMGSLMTGTFGKVNRLPWKRQPPSVTRPDNGQIAHPAKPSTKLCRAPPVLGTRETIRHSWPFTGGVHNSDSTLSHGYRATCARMPLCVIGFH